MDDHDTRFRRPHRGPAAVRVCLAIGLASSVGLMQWDGADTAGTARPQAAAAVCSAADPSMPIAL